MSITDIKSNIHFRKFVDFPDEVDQNFNMYDIDGLYWLVQDKGCWTGPLKNWREEVNEWLKVLDNFDVIVQAGGACGMYPRFWGEYFQKVYTFEPCPKNYQCLNLNCQDEKYIKQNVALGNPQPGDRYSFSNKNVGNVGTHKVTHGEGDQVVISVDSLELEACDLIHLDVENFEDEVLRGAVETIKKFKPVVITERSRGQKFLEDLGYSMKFKGRMDTVYVYEQAGS